MKTTFTFLLSLFTFTAFAQQNFVPGHYITLQGEKVEVQINDQNWDRNPTYIEVTSGINGSSVKKLSVADIKGFALSTGDVYETFVVDVDKSPTKLADIEPNSQPVIVQDTVFLRAVVKGAVSLYYLRDENAKAHYYLKKGEEIPAELIYRTIKLIKEGKVNYTKVPLYRGILKAQLTDCPEASEKFDRVAYTQKALKAVVTGYNQCVSGSKGEYVAAEEKVKWNILAMGGLSYTTLNFSGAENKALTGADFNGLNYTLGVSVLATLPRLNGRWAAQGDLFYRTLTAEDSFTEVSNISSQNYTTTDTKFNLGYLGLNTAVRYRLSNNKLRPYISAGIANSLLIANNSSQKVFRKFYTTESTTEKKPLDDVRKHEQALLLGFGVEMKKIQAELKLENGNGISPYTGLKSSRNSVTLQLGYTLK